MAELLQDLVRRARGYNVPSTTERNYERAWFFRRRLFSLHLSGKKRLFLALGMSDGFRVLEIDNTEIHLIASHDENGPVDIVEPLLKPVSSSERTNVSTISNLRLLVTSGNNRSAFPNTCVRIYSLQKKDYIHVLRLRSPVINVQASERASAFAVHLKGEVQIFGSKDFRFLYTVSCYTSFGPGPTFSLGPCWLAFAGGISQASANGSNPHLGTTIPSISTLSKKNYKETLSSLTKDVMSGLYSLGNLGGKRLAKYLSNEEESGVKGASHAGHATGFLTIFDIHTKKTLCTFRAHSHAIAYVAFDNSGSMVVTAGADGQYLHVWQMLNPHHGEKTGVYTPCAPRLVYKIFRGITHAHICNVSFSPDTRMLAISSQHGTTHIYRLEIHQSNMHGLPVISRQSETSNAENIATSTPFHRIRHQSLGTMDAEPMAMISAFHTISKTPTLAVVTSSQQLILHDLSKVYDDSAEGNGKWALKVSETWQLPTLLREKKNTPKIKEKRAAQKGNGGNKKSNWLSHVEMNTYKSNEVPFWASPQFEMESLTRIGTKQASMDANLHREIQNPDYLFWEDLNFEPIEYRKHVSFSGLKVHPCGLESKQSQGDIAINGKILDAMESPMLTSTAEDTMNDDLAKIVI